MPSKRPEAPSCKGYCASPSRQDNNGAVQTLQTNKDRDVAKTSVGGVWKELRDLPNTGVGRMIRIPEGGVSGSPLQHPKGGLEGLAFRTQHGVGYGAASPRTVHRIHLARKVGSEPVVLQIPRADRKRGLAHPCDGVVRALTIKSWGEM